MTVDPKLPPVEAAADSDIGRVRTNNEDSYALIRFECGGRPSVLALVADGVGGHAAGEVASKMVVDEISGRLQADPCADPLQRLPQTVVNASRAVFARAKDDPALRGMATTLAVAWLIGRRLFTVTVGDSRIYLRRAGKTFQASVDHTWVQEAVERGLLTPAQAKIHPNAHVLRRHLGGATDPQPDLRLRLDGDEGAPASTEHQGLALAGGDGVVLCSDGLSDLVEPEEIGRALRHRRPEKTVRELIDLARERGGHDNITVAVLRVPESETGGRRRPLTVVALSALTLVFVTTLLYLLILLLQK
jgi:serine/threonine protein phosphatase PrpC